MLRRILLATGCALAAGCGTVANQRGDYWYMTCVSRPPSEPYGGVRQDWGMLVSKELGSDWISVAVRTVAVVDLMLSGVADTILLPYDFWVTTARPKGTEPGE